MGKAIAGCLGVLASIAGILSLLIALNILHPVSPPSGSCLQGYVWRQANSSDHVCVTPAEATQVASDNSQAPSRVNPNGGPYGPDTCLQGYVWREAFSGDHVCVTPETRAQAQTDNSLASSRVVP
jgi:hypothetical protein